MRSVRLLRSARTAGRAVSLAAATVVVAVACSNAPAVGPVGGSPTPSTPAASPTGPARLDLYAHTRAGMMSPAVAGQRALVYVPNLQDGTVSVIDQATLTVVDTLKVGREPQHVVPSWDLKTLWVNNNRGNTLTPLDPVNGTVAGPAKPVHDPYNLYFLPDGSSALVMAEADQEIDFYDPHSFALQSRLPLDKRCLGVNHLDFSADGAYFIATCEFSGQLVKVDVAARKVVGYLDLNGDGPSAPQDIKIDPQGKVWYVADMNTGGLHEVDGDAFRKTGFLPTGPEAHGLYPSRDGRFLYAANRGGMQMGTKPPFPHSGDMGSVSVVDFASRSVVANWPIPGGGTPDMGNVSADGTRLWLSGRRSNVVYVFDTGGGDPSKGRLLTQVKVGREPHGLAVWPLPGRYSLGHTGILR